MSIERLKALIAVADEGSFEAAAKRSYVSRSAISLRMKALESELQVELFDRAKRPATLNEHGNALVEKAREIVDAYEQLASGNLDQKDLHGELNIGCIFTAISSVMPQSIRKLQALSPDLHIALFPDQSPLLAAKVDEKLLDAAVVGNPPFLGPNLEFKPFASEPLIVLAPKECTLTDPHEILETLPFIRFTRKFWAGQAIDDWLREQHIQVHETVELEGLDMISTMVFSNLGASVVPLWCVPPPNPMPVRRIALGPSAPPRVLGLVVRKDSPKSKLTNLLYEQILTVVESNRGASADMVEDNNLVA